MQWVWWVRGWGWGGAYSVGELFFFWGELGRSEVQRLELQLFITDRDLRHIPRFFFSFRKSQWGRGGKERRASEGWRGWPRRQQVMDGVNAWIESQTVMHSYQLAGKREIDSRPERHGEREEEGWQEDRGLVPDSSRPRCVHTQLFGWRWTVLSKAGLSLFFFCVRRQPLWTLSPSDPPNSGESGSAPGYSPRRLHWRVFSSQPKMGDGCQTNGFHSERQLHVAYAPMSALELLLDVSLHLVLVAKCSS